MLSHNILLPEDGSVSPMDWYQSVSNIPGFLQDSAQAAAIAELESLWQQLVEFKARRNRFLGRSLLSPDVPRGLYLWGGVGRGKTLLMDVLYNSLPYRRKRRIHFHNFMAEVHREMKLLAHEADPLHALAQRIIESTRLLCLDEFQVDDIADAMILGRLITELFKGGVVLITTSNLAPDDLYLHGLQRQNFLPAIALLKRELKILNVDGGNDYRTQAMIREPLFLSSDDAESDAKMASLYARLAAGMLQENQLVIRDRRIAVKKCARSVVWFEFDELCGGAHAQEDYLTIAQRFPTLLLTNIPKLTAENADVMRRFIWLIDVLYDHNVRLVASAQVELENLCDAKEFSRTASRLSEMQSRNYLQLLHRAQGVRLSM